MSDLIDNHPLGKDFPEHKEAIHTLKTRNAHFLKLHDEYETVDRDIVRAEQRLDHLSDEALEHLKMRRVRLKDELYQMIVAAN